MVLCVAESDVEKTLAILTKQGEIATVIGKIQSAKNNTEQVLIN
jgi:phosphoribosylaminoimidazole (AIR) synthetase